MTRTSFVIFTDEKLHGDENANDEKDCLQSSDLGTSHCSSSQNKKELALDSKYRYLLKSYI
jgi:hypothetical protein